MTIWRCRSWWGWAVLVNDFKIQYWFPYLPGTTDVFFVSTIALFLVINTEKYLSLGEYVACIFMFLLSICIFHYLAQPTYDPNKIWWWVEWNKSTMWFTFFFLLLFNGRHHTPMQYIYQEYFSLFSICTNHGLFIFSVADWLNCWQRNKVPWTKPKR